MADQTLYRTLPKPISLHLSEVLIDFLLEYHEAQDDYGDLPRWLVNELHFIIGSLPTTVAEFDR